MDGGVGGRAGAALLARKEELAAAITAALYAERPQLLERYGERGRVKCLEDMRYNLEHLAPAVELERPVLFTRYVTWLRDMLAARDVPADDVRRSLELTRDVIADRLAADEAEAAASVLAEGLTTLDGG
jgi:hypothetical protein